MKRQLNSPPTFHLAHIGIRRYVVAMQDLVKVAKAFADPTRVRIISALRSRELCVCELCEGLKIGQSTLSTHLAVIRDAGLVRARKEGKWVYYQLDADKQALLKAIFEFFSSSLKKDARLSRDARALTTGGNAVAERVRCGPVQSSAKRQRGCA